ncbi:amidohydrolase [Cryobacterium sp. Hh7]|nr:amidohydrolase [Cryobacterium sp. Hh7]
MLDVKVTNARIFTLENERPRAQMLGILAGRIVGFDDDVALLTATTTIDCGGRVIVPGFGDSHNHMAWFGQTFSELDLSGCTTVDEVYQAVAARASVLSADDWVVASGYDDTVLGVHPHRNGLDEAAGRRPVWLKHRSGHMCVVNTAVLELAGILDGTAVVPDGGMVISDADGPTGLLQEQAQTLASELLLPYSTDNLSAAIGRASAVYAAEGLTHVTEAGIGAGWIGRSPIELAAYTAARQSGTLGTRVQLMVSSDALHPLVAHADDRATVGLDLGLTTGFGDDWIRLGAMKIFIDGSLIGRTAAVTEPFCDHGHGRGSFQLSTAELTTRIIDAHRAGWTVAAHAIGDQAIDVALDAFAEAQRQHPRPTVRHRIEHAGIVRPDQVSRFADLGITPIPQPRFLYEVGDTMAAAVGVHRADWVYRHRTFLQHGVRVPGSSDRPIALGAPLLGMQSMVQRRTSSGATVGSAETVTADQALRAYTVDAAWIAGDEERRGTLATGKLADFVMLSEHPAEVAPEAIGHIEVLATFVDGACIHGDALVSTLTCNFDHE